LQQVVGKGGDMTGYLYGGFTTSIGIRAVLKSLGADKHQFSKILDFGCGAGRVAGWFRDFTANSQFYGVDIDDEAIAWCKDNLEGEYHRDGALPPLSFSDSSFDFVYGISVLTHLDENYQKAWLCELHRVLKPGGWLFLSVQGEDKALHFLSPAQREIFKRDGFIYVKASDPTIDTLPEFYQLGFNSKAYIESVWSEHFQVLQYIKHGPFYEQDLVVMRKADPDHNPVKNSPAQEISLPICCIDTPLAATSVKTDSLLVSGWAYFPAGESTEQLEVWLDGRRVGFCHIGIDRPDVSSAFPRFAGAQGATGFSMPAEIEHIAEGVHSVWVTNARSEIPLAATYFVKRQSVTSKWTART
jgi:SAM-dependent methyltransferase